VIASHDRPSRGGARAEALTSLAESLLRRGIGGPAIAILLRVENSDRCRPPLEAPEVERIVAVADRRERGEEARRASIAARAQTGRQNGCTHSCASNGGGDGDRAREATKSRLNPPYARPAAARSRTEGRGRDSAQ
jgi:hypothetical protein